MASSAQPGSNGASAATRPILRYRGGKWKLAPWILQHLPAHRVYVEPFGGSAAVLVQKPPSQAEIYNDLDAQMHNLFLVLRSPRLARQLATKLYATPFSRQEYRRAYNAPEVRSAAESARRTIVRAFMGQSSKGIWHKSGFDTRINPDGYISRVAAFAAMPSTVLVWAERMKTVVLERMPFQRLIPLYDRADTLFYCDPPYLPSTRSRPREKNFQHEMTEADHHELAVLLQQIKGMVAISGYPCELYDKVLYPGWARFECEHRADGGPARTEVLWLNPAAAAGITQSRLDFGGSHFPPANEGRKDEAEAAI